jgi:hypothetical protein
MEKGKRRATWLGNPSWRKGGRDGLKIWSGEGWQEADNRGGRNGRREGRCIREGRNGVRYVEGKGEIGGWEVRGGEEENAIFERGR